MNSNEGIGCFVVVMVLFMLVIKTCHNPVQHDYAVGESVGLHEERTSKTSTKRDNWLEDATLNDVTAAEWRRGSHGNKVATCGGWIVVWILNKKAAKSYPNDEDLKADAELLSREIDNMITESAWQNADNITLVAVLAGSRLNLIKF